MARSCRVCAMKTRPSPPVRWPPGRASCTGRSRMGRPPSNRGWVSRRDDALVAHNEKEGQLEAGTDIRWFERLPKVELHLHLEGAIPLEALWELVRKYGGDPTV